MKCNKCDWDYATETIEIKEKYKDSFVFFNQVQHHCYICGNIYIDVDMERWTKTSRTKAIEKFEYDLAHPYVKPTKKR